jgi:hypothetical protein
MNNAAFTFLAWAAFSLLCGCVQSPLPVAAKPEANVNPLAAEVPAPSPRRIIGRILSVDSTRGFAFVELHVDVPKGAAVPETVLISRTLDLRETGRLRVSRYLRGRTLGTTIVAGNPSVDDEVVWLAQ